MKNSWGSRLSSFFTLLKFMSHNGRYVRPFTGSTVPATFLSLPEILIVRTSDDASGTYDGGVDHILTCLFQGLQSCQIICFPVGLRIDSDIAITSLVSHRSTWTTLLFSCIALTSSHASSNGRPPCSTYSYQFHLGHVTRGDKFSPTLQLYG